MCGTVGTLRGEVVWREGSQGAWDFIEIIECGAHTVMNAMYGHVSSVQFLTFVRERVVAVKRRDEDALGRVKKGVGEETKRLGVWGGQSAHQECAHGRGFHVTQHGRSN